MSPFIGRSFSHWLVQLLGWSHISRPSFPGRRWPTERLSTAVHRRLRRTNRAGAGRGLSCSRCSRALGMPGKAPYCSCLKPATIFGGGFIADGALSAHHISYDMRGRRLPDQMSAQIAATSLEAGANCGATPSSGELSPPLNKLKTTIATVVGTAKNKNARSRWRFMAT